MDKALKNNINIEAALINSQMEELKNKINEAHMNLCMVQVGIEASGYPEFAKALAPTIKSLEDACKIME